jgi:hypothetical protein
MIQQGTKTGATNLHEKIITDLKEIFPNKTRLYNGYTIQSNNELALDNGFGVAYGSGRNGNKFIGTKMGVERDFTISLTKKYYALENESEQRAIAERELMEDFQTMVKHFEGDADLDGIAAKFLYATDSGIQQIFTESQNFIYISVTFDSEYFETL